MKKLKKSIGLLLVMLLAMACSKEEILIPPGEELSDAVKKSAVAIETPVEFSGWSNYKAIVPRTGTTIDIGGLECVATLYEDDGQWYVLDLTEIIVPGVVERHVDFPIKISKGGAVKGYWPETWYDWGNLPSGGGDPNTDVVPLISGHVGCDLHGPGISKGTINFTGTFDGANLDFVFRFNGMDNGIESTYGPDSPWNDIDGPAIFKFSFELETCE
jgi:hypothetical protein